MGDQSTNSVDRISELPNFILHRVVGFLPKKDAARTCILSKTWQNIWETFPILDCGESLFGIQLWDISPEDNTLPENHRRRTYNQRVKLMSYVDYRLRRFREENLCVKKFRLHMTLVDIGLTPRVDIWLELVNNLGVQELDLDIRLGNKKYYRLPPKALTSQYLTALRLRDCVLGEWPNNASRLRSLVELDLRSAIIEEETIQNILSCFRLMETFSIDCCRGFQRLQIYGHEKLKKMKIRSHVRYGLEKFSIEIPSLEELDFRMVDAKEMVCEINLSSACQKLKRLALAGIPIRGEWVKKMITSFSLLEYLSLSEFTAQEEVLKLSSTMLKEVHLTGCSDMVEAKLDTPNLHTLRYSGCDMPCLSSNDVAASRTAHLFASGRDNIDDHWFSRLSNFLRCGRFQDLSLYILGEGTSITFDANHFTEMQLPLLFDLENLELTLQHASLNCPALLDGLLCCLRPKILSLRLNICLTESLQKLVKRLVLGRSNDYPENHRCWRDSLKDIEFVGLKGVQLDVGLASGFLKLMNSIGERHEDLLISSAFLDELVSKAVTVHDADWLYFKLSW